uniref:Reverse transcriptase domain-containing protein n=1 Tax=Tanacetum cinerariifolium TaxID=118510 RepID=A0A699IJE5_TANCI|nr:hypothetical protein [Tanacetum cinerariifolium]
MAKLIMDEARAEQYLGDPSIECNEKYELGEELLKELGCNSYSGRVEEYVVGHIAKVLEILDPIEVAEEEVMEMMVKTMEQYMSNTRADYGSGVARPKNENKDNFELKGQFLKELRTNTFSGSGHKEVNEHIEKVLEIVDLFDIPNITINRVMLRAFLMSLTGAASRWLINEPTGSNLGWS